MNTDGNDYCQVEGEIHDLVTKKKVKKKKCPSWKTYWKSQEGGTLNVGSLFGAEVLCQEEANDAVDETRIDGGRNANIHTSRGHWRCCLAFLASCPCPGRGEGTLRLGN